MERKIIMHILAHTHTHTYTLLTGPVRQQAVRDERETFGHHLRDGIHLVPCVCVGGELFSYYTLFIHTTHTAYLHYTHYPLLTQLAIKVPDPDPTDHTSPFEAVCVCDFLCREHQLLAESHML
jgi:hypothetical protein